MTRRPRVYGVESSETLAKKLEVLEREMAAQRDAMERLKQLGAPAPPGPVDRGVATAGRLPRR